MICCIVVGVAISPINGQPTYAGWSGLWGGGGGGGGRGRSWSVKVRTYAAALCATVSVEKESRKGSRSSCLGWKVDDQIVKNS